MKPIFLAGQNVYLRPVEPEEASIFLPWLNDTETLHHMGGLASYQLKKRRGFAL